MKYRTAGAFRQVLEDRLRQHSLRNNQPLIRLRKMVAFDRFLARLAEKGGEAWVVKGGFALQLRLGERARTTQDIDVAVTEDWMPEEVARRLRQTARLDLHDWFEFEVSEPIDAATGAPRGGLRFPVRCLLDGRRFEAFHLDVGQGDAISDAPETITGTNLLDFAGIPPAAVRCYPLTVQVAEKLHAYTRIYASGSTSRVRDLVDILLAASFTKFGSSKLSRAIKTTFETRGTHAIPERVPKPPASIAIPYRKLVRELNLNWPTIKEAGQATAQFLNPILQGNANRKWDPVGWKWT